MCVLSGMHFLLSMDDLGRKAPVPSRGLAPHDGLLTSSLWENVHPSIQNHCKEPASNLPLPLWHLHLLLIILLFFLLLKKGLYQGALGNMHSRGYHKSGITTANRLLHQRQEINHEMDMAQLTPSWSS